MATIKDLGTGSFKITVSNGRDLNDRQIRKSVTYTPKAKTPKAIEKEVLDFSNTFEKRIRNGEYYSGEELTFKDYYLVWKKNYLDRSDLSERTKEEYTTKLTKVVIPKIGHLKMSKITETHIDELLNGISDKGRDPKTVKKYFTAINTVFKYAYKKRIIKENPCDRADRPKIKHAQEDLHYFTPDQARRFLDFFDQEVELEFPKRSRVDSSGNKYEVKPYTVKRKISTMFKAYYYLAIYGGFRRGEICALTWNDLDTENRTISITKAIGKTDSGQILKDPKTPKSVRTIKVPSVCFEILNEWKKEQISLSFKLGSAWEGYRGKDFDNNFVFIDQTDGTVIDTKTPSNKFRKIIDLYNKSVENEEDRLPIIRLHDLRHTSATLLLASGSDIETVSHRLGHSKASITLDIYGHAMEETDQKASDILEKVLSKGA